MQKIISGQLVNYEVIGKGKDLLILHGWGGSLVEWQTIAESLSLRYRVWRLDFSGFGGSPKPSSDWSIYEYVDFVNEFLKEFNIKNPVVMGHSFGGRVALFLKAQKLILVDAAGIEFKSLKARVFGLAADYFRWVPQNIKNIFRSPDYRSAGNMRKIFVKVINQNLTKEMTEVKCPTLIIWGEKDRVLPITQAKKIKELIYDSVIRVVWGADHWPHLSKPKEFLDILNEYI
ncbi:alpha/beta hydrolase [Candidatus Amesbacteria bacterium]|nr:alpha/beta hydrolase [Candidatus Amesbacteria bacterium]